MTETPPGVLPHDPSALLVGRLHDPGIGPCVVTVRGDELVDLTELTPTASELFDRPDLETLLRTAPGGRSWPLADVLDASLARDSARPHLLAPIDLQVIKAAGVTFARSMLERVIEELAKGEPAGAAEVRRRVADAVGGAITGLRPGSPAAEAAKQILIEEGLWSQYLEVGIGPDPEIFTKAPVLSAVGLGAQIGVLARSRWNNPEPEVVIAVTSTGQPVGATLGNDVNLRDFEGRSALLLTEAKDNNASCAIGPFVRVFSADFTLPDIRSLDIELTISGADGYLLHDTSSMAEMSRDIGALVSHAHGAHHQYPDGFVLFTGTMFAPTQDRDEPGLGFTHHEGDLVTIANPALGSLINEVTTAEAAPDWQWGIRRLIDNLARRGLLESPARA
ncbi:MAG: fumarylacetoacetate hydrolase family protein [Micromonosporaceae bacterium]|nr:fumarylacetoacetate hydrolase family protein [Micromonosporaceae bacterium]